MTRLSLIVLVVALALGTVSCWLQQRQRAADEAQLERIIRAHVLIDAPLVTVTCSDGGRAIISPSGDWTCAPPKQP